MKEIYDVPAFIQELLTASEDGLASLANKLSSILSLPIIITDPLYHVLTTSIAGPTNHAIEIDFHYHFDPSEATPFYNCVWSIDQQYTEGFGYTIASQNETHGYIFILAPHEHTYIIEETRSLVDFSASLCALYIKKLQDIRQERHQFKDAFLFDLLYGNFKKKEDIISYGAIWHWEFDQPYFVVVLSIIDYNHYSSDQQLVKLLPNLVEKKVTQAGMEPIILKKQSETIVIFPATQKTGFQNKQKVYDFITSIITATDHTSLANRVACGVGKIYENPTELYRSYQEAKVAYELGLLLKIEIPFFINIGLERILYKHDLQDLREYFDHVLGDLQRHDEKNDSELMYTLEHFALHQYDLTQASEALFLHRNTLRYRLKKIEEILEIKLDDMNNRLNILAALKIRQLHKNKLH